MHPDFEPRRDELLAAMHDAASPPVPKPGVYFNSSVWWIITWGNVVAIDGPIAIRMRDRAGDDSDWCRREPHAVASLSDPQQRLGLKGDCVVVAWFDDLALCRFFDSEFNDGHPGIGDLAGFHPGESRQLTQQVKNGTAEWFPAKPSR